MPDGIKLLTDGVLSDVIRENGGSPLVTRVTYYRGRARVFRDGQQTTDTKTVVGLTGIETRRARQIIAAAWIQDGQKPLRPGREQRRKSQH